ncbi:MAG: hypothetical protein HQL82_00225 [Magnetococcales bacterium]|nr:hypothetical protein [Magnetococcales bacterium]
MSDQADPPQGDQDEVPFMQKLLDNPFQLLALGLITPTIFYLIWGLAEVVGIPMAP